MGFVAELEFSRGGFAGKALPDEFFGEMALQLTQPASWSRVKMFFEIAL
jgi:hypothetical protein